MKFKFILMALLMSLSSVFPAYSMDKEDVIIVLTLIKSSSQGRPRSGVPISASINDGVITTESVTYSGTVTVTIVDDEDNTVVQTVDHITAGSSFTTSASNLDDGTYTIFYTLDGNIVYSGEFEKNSLPRTRE